jgi:hypothetical protein
VSESFIIPTSSYYDRDYPDFISTYSATVQDISYLSEVWKMSKLGIGIGRDYLIFNYAARKLVASGDEIAKVGKEVFLKNIGYEDLVKWPGAPVMMDTSKWFFKSVSRWAAGKLLGYAGTYLDLKNCFEAISLFKELRAAKKEELDIHLALARKGLPFDQELVGSFLKERAYELQDLHGRTAGIEDVFSYFDLNRPDNDALLRRAISIVCEAIDDKDRAQVSPQPVQLKDIHRDPNALKAQDDLAEAQKTQKETIRELKKESLSDKDSVPQSPTPRMKAQAGLEEAVDTGIAGAMQQCVNRIGDNAAGLAGTFGQVVAQLGYSLISSTGQSLLAQGTSDAAEALAESALGDPKAGRSSASSAMLAGTGAGIMGVAEGFRAVTVAAKGGVFGYPTPVLMGEAGREVVMSAGEIGRSTQPSMAIGTWVDIFPEPTAQAFRFPESRALRFARLEQEAKRREGRPYGE